jgi:short-subunit dehydrogenase
VNLFDRSLWMQALWRDAKRWRHVPVGPVNVSFKFARRELPQPVGSLGRTLPSNSSASSNAKTTNSVAMTQRSCGPAVVVGVGPGFGEHAASLFAAKGLPVALVSRSSHALDEYARHLRSLGRMVHSFPCDVTDERAVIKLMRDVENEFGAPELVIYAVQASDPGSLISTEVAAFEECWRRNCLGAFIVAREAAKRMQPLGRGTILFAGATSGTIGRKGYLNLAIGKFGLRALAQVMARELGVDGIHVAHVVIDGDIAGSGQYDGGPQIHPEELAELFWTLHMQPRSCWSSEVDARPANEDFWEHC